MGLAERAVPIAGTLARESPTVRSSRGALRPCVDIDSPAVPAKRSGIKKAEERATDAPTKPGHSHVGTDLMERRLLKQPCLHVLPGTHALQRGQGLVEYSFILVLVALVVLTMLATTGHQLLNLYTNITATLHSAGL